MAAQPKRRQGLRAGPELVLAKKAHGREAEGRRREGGRVRDG